MSQKKYIESLEDSLEERQKVIDKLVQERKEIEDMLVDIVHDIDECHAKQGLIFEPLIPSAVDSKTVSIAIHRQVERKIADLKEKYRGLFLRDKDRRNHSIISDF